MKETESKYTALEKRVYDEINDEIGKYEIRTTVIKRNNGNSPILPGFMFWRDIGMSLLFMTK